MRLDLRSLPRGVFAVGTVMVGLLVGTSSATAAQQIITSSGPLTNIYLNDNLGCQVDHSGDAGHEFFSGTNPGSCGTQLSTGGTTYGYPVGTAFTPVSQSAVTGDGSSAAPFTVVTVVDAGASGLRVTQTDAYVVGEEFYRTTIQIVNSSGSAISGAIYHAADCFLQNSDSGYGYYDSATQGIFCSANANNSPASRVEGFIPITAGSHYDEANFSTNYSRVNGNQFPDTCDCTTFQDNGAGLSWPFSFAGNGELTFSLASAFSPLGVIPNPNSPPPSSSPPSSPPPSSPPPSSSPPARDTTAPRISVRGVAASNGACRSSDFTGSLSIAEASLRRVDVFLDGKRIRRTSQKKATFRIAARKLRSGQHRVRVVATDRSGNRSSRTSSFTRCARKAVARLPRFTG